MVLSTRNSKLTADRKNANLSTHTLMFKATFDARVKWPIIVCIIGVTRILALTAFFGGAEDVGAGWGGGHFTVKEKPTCLEKEDIIQTLMYYSGSYLFFQIFKVVTLFNFLINPTEK